LSPGAIVNTLATVAAKGKPQSVFLKEASPCADGVFGKHSRLIGDRWEAASKKVGLSFPVSAIVMKLLGR